MTETQWRFLKAIADRLPEGRIVELRLFPAIRQGGAESGVAVVAVEALDVAPQVPGEPSVEAAPAALEESDDDALSSWEAPRLTTELASSNTGPLPPAGVAAGEFERVTVVPADAVRDDARRVAGREAPPPVVAEREVLLPVAAEREVPLPVAADAAGVEADETVTLDDMLDLAAADAVVAPGEPPAPRRYAVLAARYRLTLKGPDRGHWDFELTHEADAPLDTVDRVARGVARRAGDEGEPESFSADQLQLALAQPWWSGAT